MRARVRIGLVSVYVVGKSDIASYKAKRTKINKRHVLYNINRTTGERFEIRARRSIQRRGG